MRDIQEKRRELVRYVVYWWLVGWVIEWIYQQSITNVPNNTRHHKQISLSPSPVGESSARGDGHGRQLHPPAHVAQRVDVG